MGKGRVFLISLPCQSAYKAFTGEMNRGVGLWRAPGLPSSLLPTAAWFYQPDVPAPHPLPSHVTNRGPANHPPCAFSALYISQRCSTEFRHLAWTNKTHFLRLLRGLQESDVSTSPDTAEALYNSAFTLRAYLTNANTPRLSLITVNEGTYFGGFQYLYWLHTLWRAFYSQYQVERTRGGVGQGVVFMTPQDWPTGEGNLINSSSLEHCQTSPFLHLPWIHYRRTWLIRDPRERVNRWTDSPGVINRLY